MIAVSDRCLFSSFPHPPARPRPQGEPTGNLQKEPGWNGLALTLLVANASGCAGLNPDDRSGPLYALYALTRARVSCVAAPAVWQADADAMNAQLYSGYGQGAPGALGSATNAFAQFPYAVDFASTSPAVGPAAVFNARLHYNRTQLSKTGQPLNYFTRLNAPANRLANAFLSAALASANPGLNNATAGQPYMSLRYVRDMPTQGSSVSVDVGTFLGPLFYSWLAQMLLPVIVGQLVYEKEKNLRIMMKIQGHARAVCEMRRGRRRTMDR